MRYDGHGQSYDEMQRNRLERLAESRLRERNEKEKAEDAKHRDRTAKREAKKEQKMNEEKVEGFQDGGVLQSKEEIKAEAVCEVIAALAMFKDHPELKKLLEDS